MFVIVMGVSSSGKSTVGQALALRLGLPFFDADDYHSPENKAKMKSDHGLSDADRAPWLARLATLAVESEASGGAVLACSALKQAHRDVLVAGVREHRIVYIELPRAIAEQRLEKRRGKHPFIGDFAHFLAGQYRDLEPPQGAIVIDGQRGEAEVIEQALRALTH